MINTKKNLFLIFLLFFYTSSSAQSNDPRGDIFLAKSFGDVSNCGPISALMLEKYSKPNLKISNLSKKIDNARSIVLGKNRNIVSNTGWWQMEDIKKYLQNKKVKYKSTEILGSQPVKTRKKLITSALDMGNVILINVNMNDLSRGVKTGKAYVTFPLLGKAWGHYLLVVGYRIINGSEFFEVHDSYSTKGKNRLFKALEIVKAIKRYNSEVLYVNKIHKLDDLWGGLLE